MSTRAFTAALLAGLAATLLAACGIDTKKEGTPDATVTTTPGSTSTVNSDLAKRLPKRPDGVVEVRIPIQGSLTPLAIPGVSGVKVNSINKSEAEGIAELCDGSIDVLDTARLLTTAEVRACARNGVELAQPIQIASDAIVVATPNESDVGGDCLRMSTLNDIFRAGSPLTNWAQVGFFRIPLRTTGPRETTPAFQFFAQKVLGIPTNASLSNMRSDYIAKRTDDGVRFEVTNHARLRRVRLRYRGRINDLTILRRLALQRYVDQAIARRRAQVLDQFAKDDAERARSQTALTPTEVETIRLRNLRIITRELREAQARAERRFEYPRLVFLRNRFHAALRAARLRGTIGIFRFSYYELYEQQLRPMEIWDPESAAVALSRMNGVTVVRDGDAATTSTTAGAGTTGTGTTTTGTTGTTSTSTTTTPGNDREGDVVVNADQTPWCVFPSQQTITNGSYPLSRQLLLYVSKLNLEREEVKRFLTSYVERAQQLASANRLVPITENVVTINNDIIAGDDTPGVPDSTGTTTTTTTSTTPQTVPGVGQGTTTTTTPTATTPATTTSTTTTTTTP
jgi:ABC-type phosphate transport system substrate-binding protein